MPHCPLPGLQYALFCCRYQTNNNVTVKNTGTTLQVNFEPGSNHIIWAGQQLELLQYHFHTPSEHTVEGVCSSMEAHLVHKNKTTGGGQGFSSREIKRREQVQVLQRHFHTLSEDAVKGAYSSMQARLVHRDKVTGVFF
jgi:carbonic anhydrase